MITINKKELKGKKVMWHVFADGVDDWFETYKRACECYNDFRKNGYTDRRIYREEIINYGEDNEDVIENCVRSAGSFPL